MKVLITGANGQLGSDIAKVLPDTAQVFALNKQQLNVCNAEAVSVLFKNIEPDVVVHTAAYTKVDEAENHPDSAYGVNALGTRNVAVASSECKAKLIHISTDYVFDGTKGEPYNEFDQPNPINVYGHSKYAGELLVQSLHQRYFIVRTSWLYGQCGNHFVRKILSAVKRGAELNVVEDEIGSPTYTKDLAIFISSLILSNRYGIYHASNQGHCSRYEFALAIAQEAGIAASCIHPISSAMLRLPADRPKISAFDHQAIRLNGFEPLPFWRDALIRYMKNDIF